MKFRYRGFHGSLLRCSEGLLSAIYVGAGFHANPISRLRCMSQKPRTAGLWYHHAEGRLCFFKFLTK